MNMPNPPDDKSFESIPVERATCPQVFFDGFTGFLLGPANSKIVFHHVHGVNPDSGSEQRKEALTVILPTAVMVELCNNFLRHVHENGQQLEAALESQKRLMLLEPKK